MSTWSRNAIIGAACLLAACAGVTLAQDGAAASQRLLKIDFPPDSPITLLSADLGESNVSARGGAMLLDLHTGLSLRNSSRQRIRGVTLLVQAQHLSPGGKASVSVPSLDVGPGETFPVRLDLRLLRPLQRGAGPLVEVRLDGVLFEDLSFYGPNLLNSRRSMTVWELEARRDRRHLKQILEARGSEGLREEILASIARQGNQSGLDVKFSRGGGRATNLAAEREVEFAFLRFPDAPVDPMAGTARVSGNEAHSPQLEIVNRSKRPVRYLEIGWIVRDDRGREYMAGSVPAELTLAPGEKSRVLQETSLRLSQQKLGLPVSIQGMTGFVNSVEFGDGSVWIPSRSSLRDPRLEKVLAPSPEEQRLSELYRKRGLVGLIEELKKF